MPRTVNSVWTKVEDVARTEAVIVPPQMRLREVSAVMARHDIGAVVVGSANRALGILSERDVITALARGADPDSAAAAGSMSVDVVSVRPSDTLYDAAVDMLDLGIRHVAVLDTAGVVVGMVSVRDLLRPLLTGALET